MKVIVVALLLALAIAQTDSEWEEYKSQYTKSYSSAEDEATHRANWEAEKRRVDEENAKGNNYTLSTNQFSDLSEAEKDSNYLFVI